MRATTSTIFAVLCLPAFARAECPRYALFPGEGVDLEIVSDVQRRIESAGLASSGDLEDCPVRLGLEGEEIVVQVELEDRVVTRAFPADPPGETAWAIAVLLEELAPAGASAHPPEGPPPEIIPGLVTTVPVEPAPAPPPRVERPVVLAPYPLGTWIAVGPNAAIPILGTTQPVAFSIQGAILPTRLTLVVSLDGYPPGEVEVGGTVVTFWSLRAGVGPSLEAVRRRRFSGSVQALAVVRYLSVKPDEGLPNLQPLPGVSVRGRGEWRLSRRLGAAAGLVANYLPQRRLKKHADPQTAPFEVGGGIDLVIHL